MPFHNNSIKQRVSARRSDCGRQRVKYSDKSRPQQIVRPPVSDASVVAGDFAVLMAEDRGVGRRPGLGRDVQGVLHCRWPDVVLKKPGETSVRPEVTP